MIKSELEEIELTIEDARAKIERMEAVARLRLNKDWVNIVEKGYLVDEASRVVLALADPNLQNEATQKQLNNMITAIGYFRQYLNMIYQFGNSASMAIASHEETRTELMSEVN